jgi:enoyl-CoA hydratase/carnithine racemase
MLGDGVDARAAEAAGLANRVVAPERVLSEARALAERLAKGPGLAISMTKRLLNHEAGMDLAAAVETEAIAQALLLRAEDHRAFYEAHTKGEQPSFTGR